MAHTIVTKNSSTAGAVPTAGQLTKGELAVNVTDKKIYSKDNSGNVFEFTVTEEANIATTQAGIATTQAGIATSASSAASLSEINAAASADMALAQAAFVSSTVAATTPTVVNFSGDGSTVAFTLPSSPGAEENTLVFISGVYKKKTDYSVSGTTLTFTSAPPAGTNNIEVQIGPATNIALNTSLGVSYLPSGTGAVTTTVQSKLRETVSVKDFGAVGDGVADDWQAIRNALDSGALKIYFPPGNYYCSKALLLHKIYTLEGSSGFQAGVPQSILTFADNTCGIVVHRSDTTCDDYGYNQAKSATALGGGDGTTIRQLYIRRGNGANVTDDGVTHGIRLRARAHIDSCYISGFAGSGIYIVASAGGAANIWGNANNWGVSSTRVQNCQDGMYVDGGDVNAGLALQVDCSNNSRYGFYDDSFLGCTWLACHASGNTTAAYTHVNYNSPSIFLGCYQEGGQTSSFVYPSIVIGGFLYNATGTGRGIGTYDFYKGEYFRSYEALSGVLTPFQAWNQAPVGFTAWTGSDHIIGSVDNYLPIGGLIFGSNGTSNISGRIGVRMYKAEAATSISISGITNANPGVITTATAHGFAVNDRVVIASIGGMTQLNSRSYFVASVPTSTTLTIKKMDETIVDTTSYGVYTSGGTIGKSTGYANYYQFNVPSFVPGLDNSQTLGAAANRWSTVYAGTGTINTSDEREKQDIADLDAAEKRVAVALKGLVKKFRFKDAVQSKGDDARIHVGVIAQEVMAAFQAEGLDPMRYAIVCYDEWPEQEEVLDEDGNVAQKYCEAGSRYGVRYEQLLAFIISAL